MIRIIDIETIGQHSPSLNFNNQELHVFLPNSMNFTGNLGRFKKMYNERTRLNKEIWLLDILNLPNEDIHKMFDKTNMDMGKQLYFYKNIK